MHRLDFIDFWVVLGGPGGPKIDKNRKNGVPKNYDFCDTLPEPCFQRFGAENGAKTGRKSMKIRARKAPAAQVKKTHLFKGRAWQKQQRNTFHEEKREKSGTLKMLISYCFLQ